MNCDIDHLVIGASSLALDVSLCTPQGLMQLSTP